ncbi:hypothetical protein [Thermanaeromonas toyohensis]|uniref:hypothetical protein n=1 Tax=Thermanaeromonas toyohensis TaxID=161154 RepID=UPI0012F4C797|nr:hypothetical protein [Thermanaeromonas toyohensis]
MGRKKLTAREGATVSAITLAGTKRKFRLPRSLWLRKPATRVVPDRKKEESRRACRRKEWEKELEDMSFTLPEDIGRGHRVLLEVLFAVCVNDFSL